VQGDSSAQVWELVAARGQTTLTVGSGPSSSWVIRADGVRPLHFSLHWDGDTLGVADTYGAGDVRADGSPVTAQWRSLSGRMRIEFGKAAMVAETSASVPQDPSHPLEPGPLPPMAEASPPGEAAPVQSVSVQRMRKATLIGVSPLANGGVGMGHVPGAPVMGGAAASTPRASGSEPRPADTASLQPARPDSERTRKPTLLGMAITLPAAAPGPADTTEPLLLQTPAGPSKGGIPSGTLIGVAGPLEVHVQRFASVSEQGAPGAVRVALDDMRVGGVPAAKAEQPAGTVTKVEVRTVSSPPSVVVRDRTERIGSTWQEVSGGPEPVPAAVMVGSAGSPRGSEAEQPVLRPSLDGYDTYGDIPTQMREAAGLESKRPTQPFPWRYVGIGVLTAAAYFAWLYLLDHL